MSDANFDELLEANRRFAETFGRAGFDGVAQAGVAIVTCMDSRIDPLGVVGVEAGIAKIFPQSRRPRHRPGAR